MANVKKPEDKRLSKSMPLRMTEGLHKRLMAQQEATGISVSDRARQCLERQLAAWERESRGS